jgi:hypothetical protein
MFRLRRGRTACRGEALCDADSIDARNILIKIRAAPAASAVPEQEMSVSMQCFAAVFYTLLSISEALATP